LRDRKLVNIKQYGPVYDLSTAGLSRNPKGAL
jgi:hypothetical protein